MKPRYSRSLFLACLLRAAAAVAQPISIEVPAEGWNLSFDPPPMQVIEPPFRPKGFAYVATAGRLNVSFFVDPPSCPGGEANDVRRECFMANLHRNPLVAPTSIRSADVPLGVLVIYGIQAPIEGGTVRQIHAHLLFTRSGKEADFHASIVQPGELDGRSLNRLMSSVKVFER